MILKFMLLLFSVICYCLLLTNIACELYIICFMLFMDIFSVLPVFLCLSRIFSILFPCPHPSESCDRTLYFFVFFKLPLIFALILLFIYFCSDWAFFVVLFQVPFSVKLNCFFELFLLSWDRPVMLWLSLLRLRSLCHTDLGLLYFHLYVFQDIFWFLYWSHC